MKANKFNLNWKTVSELVDQKEKEHPVKNKKMNKVMKDYFDFLSNDEQMASLFVEWEFKQDIFSTEDDAAVIIRTNRQLSEEQRLVMLKKVSEYYWQKQIAEAKQQRTRK